MHTILSKLIDENIQIDTELSTLFLDKTFNRIRLERKIAYRLKVSYQKYFIIKEGVISLL